jgi:hypothetical protein
LIGIIAFVYTRWNQLPSQIPGHYNAMGKIDRWGSKNEILIMPIMGTLLYIFITVMSFFPQTWNLPVKVTDENKETVYTSAKSLIIFTKVEVLSIFLYITYYTATTQPLPIAFLPVSMIILFSTIIFFTVRIYRTGTRKKQTSQ